MFINEDIEEAPVELGQLVYFDLVIDYDHKTKMSGIVTDFDDKEEKATVMVELCSPEGRPFTQLVLVPYERLEHVAGRPTVWNLVNLVTDEAFDHYEVEVY